MKNSEIFKSLIKTFQLLIKSLFSNDILILIFAIITAVFFILTLIFKRLIRKEIKKHEKNIEYRISKNPQIMLNRFYTLFVSFISIFPLLGMLGTVIGLLGLDLTTGNMENIRNNFFIALTSTAWGIIFSVLFKILHAFHADDIEEQIELAKKLSDNIE